MTITEPHYHEINSGRTQNASAGLVAYAEIRPTYPASKAEREEITYAAATIIGSLIPHNSRWRWNGAIWNKRRPLPGRRLVVLK